MPYGIFDSIECLHGSHEPFTPQEHQKATLDYFINNLKYKGLLLYHRLGSGKSCTSIMTSDEMLEQAKVKKVYILTPGSLRQNFIEEYCDKCGKSPEFLKKHYIFVTTNYAVGNRLPNFDNSLVIIDEIHNLINGVKNQSKHATLIYNALLNSSCKILALTGTPTYNFIYEWPLLGNLLKPGTFADIIKHGELDTEAFMKEFIIDKEGNVTPKNPKVFKIKLKGIVSYFPGITGGFYPKVIYEDPIKIRMTIPQDAEYWETAHWEEKTRAKGPPDKSLLKKNPSQYYEELNEYVVASKYIMSRMISNFFYPKDFISSITPETRDEISHIGVIKYYKYKNMISLSKEKIVNDLMKNKKEIRESKLEKPLDTKEKKDLLSKIVVKVNKNAVKEYKNINIGWVDKKYFSDKQLIDVYSRKVLAVVVNIIKNWKAKHMIFTFYKTKAGVNIIHALFKMCGVKTEVYSGDISDNQRRTILSSFNSEKNRYGDNIKALLVTEAGAEGINVLETQHMHILESSTREMKIQQAIGRIVRYRSHMVEGRKPMPKNEQVAHIWRYWSVSSNDPVTLTREIKKTDGSIETKIHVIVNKTAVDEDLYNKGRLFVNTLQSFLSLLKQSSVTKYDKSQDKGSMLKNYNNVSVRDDILKACVISDKRYIEKYGPYNKLSKKIEVVDADIIDEDKDKDLDEKADKIIKKKIV